MKLDGIVLSEIEMAVQKKQQQEYKKLGQHRPTIDGYKIFEFDKVSGIISPATFRENTAYIVGGDNLPALDIKKGRIYIEALNEKNAVKRLRRGDFFYSS
jgi:hypothetical protein